MNHQRLKCYQLAMSMTKAMPGLISLIPKEEYKLIDKLRRAMHSSMANLAEGNGRFSTKERSFYWIESPGNST